MFLKFGQENLEKAWMVVAFWPSKSGAGAYLGWSFRIPGKAGIMAYYEGRYINYDRKVGGGGCKYKQQCKDVMLISKNDVILKTEETGILTFFKILKN